jgi:hypothetical protein
MQTHDSARDRACEQEAAFEASSAQSRDLL